MLTLLETTNSPLVSVIFAGVASAKLMVSPFAALASAPRSEPVPLSAALVTVIVAACRLASAVVASMAQKPLLISRIVVRRVLLTPASATSAGDTYQRTEELF